MTDLAELVLVPAVSADVGFAFARRMGVRATIRTSAREQKVRPMMPRMRRELAPVREERSCWGACLLFPVGENRACWGPRCCRRFPLFIAQHYERTPSALGPTSDMPLHRVDAVVCGEVAGEGLQEFYQCG